MLPRPSKSHNPVRRVKSNPDPSKLQNSMVDIDEAMEVKSPDEKKIFKARDEHLNLKGGPNSKNNRCARM